ncbi:MAG: hypothetical protein A2560_06720 [Bdellovibrionales bacterium RIFOXYD1_FULL_39_84]|nr:MAG: hypothetical protein A2560_06720 [Bdellovibrionales bacterium RIFOXYD1_FULL_39_84]HLE12262.1 LuxR C-terminal-related transcriptional regulator [Bacteriovoracaceae bacterium]
MFPFDTKILLNSVAEIICTVDNNRVYTWMNRAGINFFGENAIGKEISYFLHNPTEDYKNIQPVLKDSEQVFCVINWQERKDGVPRLMSWWRKKIRNDDGLIIGEVLTGRDITERKMAEIEKDQLIYKLKKRNSELDCLYAFSKLVQRPQVTASDILKDTPQIVINGLNFKEFASCKITFQDHSYNTDNFVESRWGLSRNLIVNGAVVGRIEVYYERNFPQADQGPFFKEEVHLLDAISDNISKTVERLINAQEIIDERQKLQDANVTLKNVLSRLEEEKAAIKENIALNIEKNIIPLIDGPVASDVELLKSNLNNITSDFYRKIVNLKYNLTPTEIEICRLVKVGNLSKKIAEIMNISYATVTTHKKNIRRKLKISNSSTNLRTYLSELL